MTGEGEDAPAPAMIDLNAPEVQAAIQAAVAQALAAAKPKRTAKPRSHHKAKATSTDTAAE